MHIYRVKIYAAAGQDCHLVTIEGVRAEDKHAARIWGETAAAQLGLKVDGQVGVEYVKEA